MAYDFHRVPELAVSTEIFGAWIFAFGLVGIILFTLDLFV